jgi:rod shape-determining protein MreC
MENIISRYRNVTILVAVLFAQVLGLAVQVKRAKENESTRLIRVWAVGTVTPLEKGIVWLETSTGNLWRNYLYLRGVRQENRDLKQEIQRLRLQQVRLSEDAEQARRLQALLAFKEQFISETMAAQVIGSSGSEQSRSVFVDKGARDGIKPDMAVITADGVVGKVLRVYNNSTAEVLRIDDQTSGVGAILEKSRLQGILRGTASGEIILEKVMADEQVEVGERVLTSGGDQIFPKGLLVGTVTKVGKGSEAFLNIWIKPIVNLSRLEEVLIITKKEERAPTVAETGPARAVDILSQRLPSVPDKPVVDPTKSGDAAGAAGAPKPGTPNPKPNEAQAGGTTPSATKPQTQGSGTQLQPHPPTGVAAGSSAPTAKPAGGTGQLKPATEQKATPSVTSVSEQSQKAGAAKPNPEPVSPQTEPPPAEDKPH